MILRPLSLLLICGAVPAAAQVFTGRYLPVDAPISEFTQPSDRALEVRETELQYWESTCQLLDGQLLPGLDGAVLYQLQCTGEGETWSDAAILMPTDAGMYTIRSGFVLEYRRC